MAVEERLYTVPEWAALIGVSRTTAYAIIGAGQVERVDVGLGSRPRVRISESAHRAYVAGRRPAASTTRPKAGAA